MKTSNNRVYIKAQVLNTDLIFKIQEYIKKELNSPSIKYIDKEKLHLTIFYIGKPEELFEEIHTINSNLKYNIFITYFSDLVNSFQKIIMKNNQGIKINALGILLVKPMSEILDMFGDNESSAIVLRLKKIKIVDEIRKELMDELKLFLRKCEISDVDHFMKESKNLKWQVRYNPHISIAISEEKDINLPKGDVSKMQILLGEMIVNS